MKKLTATLFIALIVAGLVILGSLPVSATTNANLTTESESSVSSVNASSLYRIPGQSSQTFTRFVNRGHVDVLISGDGSTDLDLYVYIGGEWIKSDSNSDDEKICLGTISRSGNITIMVVNRGYYANDYQLIIK